MSPVKIGVIADDFTGASDISMVLSENGMRTVQYSGTPKATRATEVDAGVIALKTRTTEKTTAINLSLEAADWLLPQGCDQLIYKVCSTFDSTREGNIGPVTEALAKRLNADQVLVCPAYPEMNRTVFQGHLFVKDQLLSECGMQNHPLTPMTDPDIRRWLSHQCEWPVHHLSLAQLRSDICQDHAKRFKPGHILVDAINHSDLMRIGSIASGYKLVTGAAGIAHALAKNYPPGAVRSRWVGTKGKGVVLCGSCSYTTLAQIEHYAKSFPVRDISVESLIVGSLELDSLVRWVLRQDKDRPGLLFTTASPERVQELQNSHGRVGIASMIETMFAKLSRKLIGAGVTRMVVAGGETSGAVVEATGIQQMEIGPRIAAGVPAMHIPQSGLAIALKSGNFGEADFFEHALRVLQGEV